MKDGTLFLGWVRIDDRLIHGQVTVGWRQYLKYREIWVVDDEVREDPYLWDALRLAVPAGVEARRLGVGEAATVLTGPETAKAAPAKDRTTNGVFALNRSAAGSSVLMLLREPEVAVALVEGGVSLARVNVGNLGSRPGSVRVFKNVSLTAAHVAALDALARRGIEVFFQLAPEDPRLEWEVVRRRLRL